MDLQWVESPQTVNLPLVRGINMEEQKPVEPIQSQPEISQTPSAQTSQKPFPKWVILVIVGLIILVLGWEDIFLCLGKRRFKSCQIRIR